jgi:CBS-domain-containing membrane protein|tara:strand:+ start:947 stop:1447 length:501 start_codon:yes stop_codon:yes gene_type:complete
VYNLNKEKIYMKITEKLEPVIAGLSASVIIGVLAFLSFETSTGYWLMISFGATSLITFVLFDKEFAQPGNIFFGHLLGIIIGILFNEIVGNSPISLALAVGTTVTLMMYLKVIHPPAAANPLIAILGDVSIEFIIFPVMTGSLAIVLLSVIINKFILRRNYPTRWI